MKFIYNCYGAAHSSITAAGLHLGLLPEDRPAGNSEFLSLPYYDATSDPDHGRIRFMGFDDRGHEVYIASKKSLGGSYEKIMRTYIRIAEGEEDRVVFIDTMPYVNIFMVIGGFLSRRLGFNRIGRAIILCGTRISYRKFAILAHQVKTMN